MSVGETLGSPGTFQKLRRVWTDSQPHAEIVFHFMSVILSEDRGCLEEGCLGLPRGFSQTFSELEFSLGNEGKEGRNRNSQTCLDLPDVLLPDMRGHLILGSDTWTRLGWLQTGASWWPTPATSGGSELSRDRGANPSSRCWQAFQTSTVCPWG